MRILVTSFPAYGHFFPLVAFAWALRATGHEVLVAGPRLIAKEARNAGLPAAVVGTAAPPDIWANAQDPSGHNDGAVAEFGVTMAEHTTQDLLKLAGAWRPDLVLTEPMDLTGPLAAAARSIPLVVHRWGLQVPETLLASITGPVLTRVDALYDRFGLSLADTQPDGVIDNCPPSLRLSESSSWMSMRYVPYCGTGIVPSWLFEPRTRPRVCVSMGSIPIAAGVDALRITSEALAEMPADVVVCGAGSRTSALGDLPENALAAGWLPHDQVLPTCDLLVHHGGAGSSMAALTYGLPQLVLPQMGDQFANAAQLTRRGVARQVPFADRGVEAVRDAARTVLTDGSYGYRAREVRAEIAAMRTPIDLVGDVEHVASTGKSPMPAAQAGSFPSAIAAAAGLLAV